MTLDVSGCLGRDGASGGLERVTAVAAVAATKSDLSTLHQNQIANRKFDVHTIRYRLYVHRIQYLMYIRRIQYHLYVHRIQYRS